jgi:hypothetical protein
MSWRHPTAQDWDHKRDLAKHEPRPSDPLPARFIIPVARALEVAVLVKGLKDIRDAAALIEQYAQTVAAEASLQATITAGDRILAVFDAHSTEGV